MIPGVIDHKRSSCYNHQVALLTLFKSKGIKKRQALICWRL
jgi:hypothetical protein